MKSANTCGCRIAPVMPAKTAERKSAIEAGTLRAESTTSSTRGSRFHGVMWNTSASFSSSTSVGAGGSA